MAVPEHTRIAGQAAADPPGSSGTSPGRAHASTGPSGRWTRIPGHTLMGRPHPRGRQGNA
eukprot:12891739-Prorocentrum_lima.AAC.1